MHDLLTIVKWLAIACKPPLLSRFSLFNVKFLVIRHLTEVCLLSQWGDVESLGFVPFALSTSMPVITTNHSLSPFSFTRYTIIKPYGFLTLSFFVTERIIKSISGLPFFLLLHPNHLAPACTPEVFSTLSSNITATACRTKPLRHLYLLTFVQGGGISTLVLFAFWILTMLAAIHLRWAYDSFQSP